VKYVKRIGDHLVECGGTIAGRPKAGSVPFFCPIFGRFRSELFGRFSILIA
jgi:hypothetical protein